MQHLRSLMIWFALLPLAACTGWFEPVWVHAPYLGAGNILWSTNFPLATSTWPTTGRYLSECFQGVSNDDRTRILWTNPAQLYGVEQAKKGN